MRLSDGRGVPHWGPPKGSPVRREPLYTLAEIEDRHGLKHRAINGLLGRHREKAPAPTFRNNTTGLHMYRLSEFDAWVAHHNIDLARYKK